MSKNCPPCHLCLLLAPSKLSFQEDSPTITSECCRIVFFLCSAQNLNILSCTFAKILRGQSDLFVFYESVSHLKQCVLPPQRVISLLFQFFLNLRKALFGILKQLRTAFFLLNFPSAPICCSGHFISAFLCICVFLFFLSFFFNMFCMRNGVAVYARIMGCMSLCHREGWHMKRILSFSFIFPTAVVCPGRRSCG